MTNEPSPSMEMAVVDVLSVAPKSREAWEAQLGEGMPPMSDEAVMIENMVAMVNRHGALIIQLTVSPETHAELEASLTDAVKRIPAWIEAKFIGPPLLSPRLFIRGLAQLLGEHRRAIARVTAEQVPEPKPIEELLAAAPLPAGGKEESDGEMIAAVGEATVAHAEALVEIARDFDRLRRELAEPD
jgi:hypothetical protein